MEVTASEASVEEPVVVDTWYDPPDASMLAVSVDEEKCVRSVKDVAELAIHLNQDPYSEDETEMRFLYSKPTCFLLLGKPGVGKTTLARRFAAEWKCELINSTDLILQNMELQTEMGLKCVEILTRGEAIPDEMVLKIIEDKINSPEVAHHGYIMDDFPCLSESLLSIKDQLELIKSWKLKPDFIINLRIPDKDIERRRLGQKIDPQTADLYTRDVYAPDKPMPPPSPDKEEEDEDEDEEAEDEEEPPEDEEPLIELPLEVLERLIKRPEDLPQQVEENLNKYKDNSLRILEDYMADHDQQYLIEMDGNQTVLTLFKQMMQKLLTFVLRPAAVVNRLNDPEEEEIPEEIETEELMRALGPKQMVAPRYRWRRSKWLRNCPVALYEGNITSGKPEFAVSFLDKVYCLSSSEALEKFVKNPRPYLLPDQPRPPCKLSVIGSRLTGKTTLCNLIAHKYGGKVFEITELTKERREEDKKKMVEQVRKETTELAIQQVKAKIKEQMEAEAAAREEERLARLAEEAAREQEERERLEALRAEAEEEGEQEEGEEDEEGDKEQPPGEEKVVKEEEGDEEKEAAKTPTEEEAGTEEEKGEEGAEVPPTPSGTSMEEPPPPPPQEPEVNETHPDVVSMVMAAVADAEKQDIILTPDVQAEVLDMAIKDWEKELRNKKPDGPLHGCWILDNFPCTREQWNACMERNLLPDDVIILGEDSASDSSTTLNFMQAMAERFCKDQREFLLAQMDLREKEKKRKEEEAILEEQRRVAREMMERARQEELMQEELLRQQAEADAESRALMEEADSVEAAARRAELDRKAELLVDQILWDTLAGELQTKPSFHKLGFEQPRGPSFISLLPEMYHDYSVKRTSHTSSEEEDYSKEAKSKTKGKKRKEKHEGEETEEDSVSQEESTYAEEEETEEEAAKIDGEGEADGAQVSQSKEDEAEEDKADEEKEDTPEPTPKTELEILMEQPEVLAFIEKMKEVEKELANLVATITGTSAIEPFTLSCMGQTPEYMLSEVIKHLERLFKYFGWDLGSTDLDEEEEDLEAETMEAEEETPEDEEAVEEEEEDPNRSIKRKFLGDSNYFDPVILKETDILYPGNPETASMYREKVYYFSTNETREKFLEDPPSYLTRDCSLKPPPIRLLILGARGAGKSLHGRYLAEKLGIFHISFRERLQELIIAKTKKKIGPEFEEEEEVPEDDEEDGSHWESAMLKMEKELEHFGDNENYEEEENSDQSVLEAEKKLEESIVHEMGSHSEGEEGEEAEKEISEESAQEGQAGTDIKQPEPTIIEEEEDDQELTEDEEAIKANLESNDALPPELLANILTSWWTMEPFKSTGFILEGFPRSTEEVKFLQESGLFPDAAIILQVSDDDVIGRLLPPKLDKWKAKRDKRLAKKARKKERAQKKREVAMAKRREELVKEREEQRQLRQSDREGRDDSENEDDIDEEEEEDEEDDIEAILAEEFEEEEEEEEDEEEQEEDAVERMRNDFNEVYDDDTNRLSAVEETLEEVLIPRLDIVAGRKPHIVRYILNKKLKPYVEFRHSLFERVYPLNERQAKRMLQVGYKHPSRFGRWDPVKMKDGDCIQPMNGPGYPSFPCFYRSHIYFLSSHQNRQIFSQDPMTYLKQDTPKPVVPIKIAIIGPPKSGKTTLANRFVADYGAVRLSIGEAMRQVLTLQPKSELAKQMNWLLLRGRVVSDELQIQALEVAMLDMRCQTRGYILDGFPMNRKQIDLLTERSIIPVRVIELELDSKEVMVRAVKDRVAPTRTMPLHDSAQIQAIKLSCYLKTVGEVRDWYHGQHQNHRKVAANESKWWVWDAVNALATSSICRIQDYLQRTAEAKAAGIADLCITPTEFNQRVGDFGQYCPVSLAEWGELVDCSINPTLEFAAEFRGHYYKMASQKELAMFLSDPEKYVPPQAPRKLPPQELLPGRIKTEDVKSRKPEILGYCPVTYLDGKLRYEALVPGSEEFMVEYKEKIYLMQSEEKLFKFMKLPENYSNLKLPHKLPPKVEELPLTNLPMLGFMEQTSAVAMVKALTAAGNAKPKYPFISSTRSALIYIAYHLKAYNPKSSPYIRKKYKQKLQQFEETCELIKYLGNNMTVRYRDPNERPKDFDAKLETFFALRGVEPTPTWIT